MDKKLMKIENILHAHLLSTGNGNRKNRVMKIKVFLRKHHMIHIIVDEPKRRKAFEFSETSTSQSSKKNEVHK